MTIKLDWHVNSLEERESIVKDILNTRADLTAKDLDELSNYLVFLMNKKDMKKHTINTRNRMVTINRHETSFEGLCGKLESGENGLYSILSDLGKQDFLIKKDPITEADTDNVTGLKELQETILQVKKRYDAEPAGKRKYLLKKQLIELYQDQYVLRDRSIKTSQTAFKAKLKSLLNVEIYDKIYFDENGEPVNDGPISLFNPTHIREILSIYSELKQELYDKFYYDSWGILMDLEQLIDETLQADYPIYYDLLIYKIDKKTHNEIQELLYDKYHVNYSIEQISTIWRKKIPNLIADKAKENYILWYYTFVEYGNWKKCNRCGEIKLAHNRFFSKNKTAKDGFYSLCKECRNAKGRKTNAKKIEYKGVK